MPEEYPDLLEILSLHLASGIGWRLYQKLETAFGSARAILSAPQSRLEAIPGIGPVRSQAILAQRSMDAARQEIERARQHGIRILDYYHPDYPLLLQQTSDPPLILYVRGTLTPADGDGLSIVGTRQCSLYARDTARKFARQLAELNRTVVSGLARGIDTAAHLGALDGNGRTLAVLGSGLLQIYPRENDELYDRITRQGAVLSEFPLNMPAAADHFPRRNRIIAWLTRASLVVEGDEKSGAMITARFANEEGRTVLALPGRIDAPITRGPHSLIRDGATLVRDFDDILEVLRSPYLPTPGPIARQRLRQEAEPPMAPGPSASGRIPAATTLSPESAAPLPLLETEPAAAPKRKAPSGSAPRTSPAPATPPPAALAPAHAKIYNAIPPHDPVSFEALLQSTGLTPGELSAALIVMEVRRQVKRLPGPQYERA